MCHQARDQTPAQTLPNTRIVWRGDGHYGRVEEMERAESDGTIIFSASPAMPYSMP